LITLNISQEGAGRILRIAHQPLFRDLFETESVLKSIFIAKMYEIRLNEIWTSLYQMKDWTVLLKREKQILSEINKIPPTALSWLDLVNLYGYLIGEHIFTMQNLGIAKTLSRLPGNHPHQFALMELKGFDRTIERKGRLTSYYATYAIEKVCTFSYVALRDDRTRKETESKLLKELNQRLASTPDDVVLREKEAIGQIHLLEEALRFSPSGMDNALYTALRRIRGIVSNLLPSINKWIYLTYADTNKEHGEAITRMSARFSHSVLVLPDFEVKTNGRIKVQSFPIFESVQKIKPRKKTLQFVEASVLPSMRNEDCRRLIKEYWSNSIR
jgi:hypothetical protein